MLYLPTCLYNSSSKNVWGGCDFTLKKPITLYTTVVPRYVRYARVFRCSVTVLLFIFQLPLLFRYAHSTRVWYIYRRSRTLGSRRYQHILLLLLQYRIFDIKKNNNNKTLYDHVHAFSFSMTIVDYHYWTRLTVDR